MRLNSINSNYVNLRPNYIKNNTQNKKADYSNNDPSFTSLPGFEYFKNRFLTRKIKYTPCSYDGKYDRPVEKDNIDTLRQRIDNFELSYNPLDASFDEKKTEESKIEQKTGAAISEKRKSSSPKEQRYKIEEEAHVKTTNRSEFPVFNAPKFVYGQDYHVEVPVNEELNLAKSQSFPIKELYERTIIETDYAKSIQWDSDKIARDILQNFFDGHGQTLDGVKVDFEKQENGKYKIKIQGKSTFDPDKAIMLGESTKREDNKAAGNFGEGLKMTVLKLLTDYDVDNCNIGSNNWNVEWKKDASKINGKEVLAYHLTPKEEIEGNYFEFETADRRLLDSLSTFLDRFYYSGNEKFHNPDFENDILGVKLLPEGEKGSIYICGMEFEYNDKFDNFPGANIFIKEKMPKDVFNPTRDRFSIKEENLFGFGDFCTQKTGKEEVVELIDTFRAYWPYNKDEKGRYVYIKNPIQHFLSGIVDEAYYKDIKIDFPKDFVSMTYDELCSDEGRFAEKFGSVPCDGHLRRLGMTPLFKALLSNGKYKLEEPDKFDIKKIGIINEAMKSLEYYLHPYFDDDEMKPKIYLTNELADKAAAEAIKYDGHSYGMYMDKNHLDCEFATVLATVLHEISHKAGGDTSSEFSYLITDVLRAVNKAYCENPELTLKMKDLSNLWYETGQVQTWFKF